ncbi:c-type cytochrome [Chryseobacterium chendengshani]|uniref:c-type cytochrome n=1 Tax=Chryseobacterium sp. LJ668 TaxID=2864040 RepID=UPI001C6916A0|nr:c-type cytochrome [Chryseobacterium sp. LJ668]MBW8523064.1 c-type cytochrome [Chryseobacterium sp. LJ668]QYK16591.1 c-type cytochrome [Chryseobacterium sp. LJ668]
MKKLFVTGIISLLIISCSKKENSEIQSSAVSTPVTSNVSGQNLIEASDCMSCHNADERLIGPSYKEIAAKYSEKDMEMLASKIIEGGSGVWGNVLMQPHPQISKEDAKKMVEYILRQKK